MVSRQLSVIFVLLQLNWIQFGLTLPKNNHGKALLSYWETFGVVPDVIDAAPAENITVCSG